MAKVGAENPGLRRAFPAPALAAFPVGHGPVPDPGFADGPLIRS